MVFSATIRLLLVAVFGGHPYFGGSVGWDEDVPFEAFAVAMPMAFDTTGYAFVVAVDVVQSVERIGL